MGVTLALAMRSMGEVPHVADCLKDGGGSFPALPFYENLREGKQCWGLIPDDLCVVSLNSASSSRKSGEPAFPSITEKCQISPFCPLVNFT